MTLRVYNSMSGEKELFTPVEPGKVKIYLCGPTVYRYSHIGHAVGPIIFDAVKRYLSFKGYQVTWIVNITDVDDKLIEESKATGETVEAIATRVTDDYLQCLRELGVNSIDLMPKATEHIDAIVRLIERLALTGAAYAIDGDVYFDIAADADYGKLTHRDPGEQAAGTRELRSADRKRNPGDFVLWKSAREGEPAWDSPWGKGRPGWHIECSAMSMQYLGETFDIHGGGMDLKFPHHENEIAQSETATGKTFAKYWLHNGLTRINTKKAARSERNAPLIRELLASQGAESIRFLVLSTQYRRPIEFNDEAMAAVNKQLSSFYRLFERIARMTDSSVYTADLHLEGLVDESQAASDRDFAQQCLVQKLAFMERMDDDFNTAGAISVLHDLAGLVNRYIDEEHLESKGRAEGLSFALGGAVMIVELGRIIGLFEQPPRKAATSDALADSLMKLFIELRQQARAGKNFALADNIRDRLAEIGVVLEDRSDGTIWRKE
ncbi:MAG: Cysteine--tRNA ligase [Phycisphaerae bacterium]|nr:Cysteine--tRNA ligase [Phycisphaerae bacterium]